jgi:S-adenosylmethionine-dependent methyltransferase
MPHPLHILDVGGGNGIDAIAFAKQGHTVTLLDQAAEMLADAQHCAEIENLTETITFCCADLTEIPTLFPEPVFDVLLCHNVIQYVEDPVSMLQAIVSALKPHGIVSLIGGNRYSEAYREALQQRNLHAAQEKLDVTVTQSHTFHQPIRLYTADEVVEWLQHIDCTVIQQYGIRCVFDYISDNAIKADPQTFTQIERLEYRLSGRYPYYLLARYFHIVAQKPGNL